MSWIKTFEQFEFYEQEWKKLLPEKITVYKADQEFTFHRGNIMENANMTQISFEMNPKKWGVPETFEIDIYEIQNGQTKLDVDFTFGDLVVCEFSIEGNKVKVIQHTSFGSKFDPSNTLFAIDDESIKKLVELFNAFGHGISVKFDDFSFLSKTATG